MQYYFIIISFIFCAYALILKNVILFWPALSFFLIGISYIKKSTKIFGKAKNGRINFFSLLILFPYSICTWFIWHIVRIIQKENAYHYINEKIVVGRRLFPHEFPNDIDIVLDLTCEFYEAKSIVKKYDYRSFPILDGSVVNKPKELILFLKKINLTNKTIYIHCAQGHGRTLMVTTLLLVLIELAPNFENAVKIIQEKRPLANMTKEQLLFLAKESELLF